MRIHPLMPTVLRVAELQLAWWATVLLANHGYGIAAIFPQLAVVLLYGHRHRSMWAAALQAAIGVGVGALGDGVLMAVGAVVFPAHTLVSVPFPAFMLALWAGFAVVFIGPASSLSQRPLWGVLLGAGGGVLAYRGGAGLGAILLPRGLEGMLMIAVVWAVAMPLLAATGAAIRGRSVVSQ